MENDIVIKAEHVSKKFSQSIKHVMVYGTWDISRDFLGIKSKTENLRKGEFWAVDDVSFELNRGRTLGIIGPNGSGKSTILKMLNGIYMPDKGKIQIKGRVGALIEVGAGFHPMLTGRENIYINGSILGMSKKEIDKKFDEIVEFAELWDFLDSPVRHYSSGMYVRLGFSIAVHVEPEILLVDEVLSVGDFSFIIKSVERMKRLRDAGTTILFVSHNLEQVAKFCSRVLVLISGTVKFDGPPNDAIRYYRNTMLLPSKPSRDRDIRYPASQVKEEISISKVNIIAPESKGFHPVVNFRDPLHIEVHLLAKGPPKLVHCHLKFRQLETGNECAATTRENEPLIIRGNSIIDIKIEEFSLSEGVYMLDIFISDPEHLVDHAVRQGERLEVVSKQGLGKQFGIAVFKAKWEIKKV